MAEKISKVVEEIGGLSVLELNELVKTLEEKFGVQAFMPMAAAPAGGGAAEAAGPSKVSVVLTDSGANKIQVIKALREINPQLGLKDAKDIVDAPPQTIKEGIPSDEAQTLKEKLEAAGAKVTVK